jgi:PAS domain S-box-containing protein
MMDFPGGVATITMSKATGLRKYLHFSWIFFPSSIVVIALLWAAFATLVEPYHFPHQEKIGYAFVFVSVVTIAILAFASWGYANKEMERLQQEQKIRLSEIRFRTLLDSAPDAIVIVDREGRINMVNNQTENWFGYKRDQLIGEPVEILVPERFRQIHTSYRNHFNAHPATRPMGANADLTGRRKDGSEFPVEISLSPSSIADELWVTAIVRDISARKEIETSRQQAQNRLSELVNNLPVGVFRIMGNDISHFREVNPAMIDIFAAQSAEELMGQALQSLFYEPKDWMIYQEHVKGKFRMHTLDLHFRKLNGEDFFGSLTIAAKRAGDELVLDGILEDISERKLQSEHIQTLNEHLASRSAELEVINRELESFSYSVSHDLRAPLRAMDGFSSTLLTDYGDKLDERGRDRLLRVRSAAQKMATLIDDLLNLSRVSRAELAWEEVDLSELAQNIFAELRQTAEQRPVNIHITPGMHTHGDRRLLGIVLTNLLNNAWKFTGQKNPAIIEVGREELEGEPVFFVRDNGAGFDMAYAGKLFGAFQRLHDAGEFPGTGIGLATVQRVIHKHGGRIWAESAVDAGATFYFTIKEGKPS